MIISFFCNCNSAVGYGHFFRCLNLARALKVHNEKVIINFAGDLNNFACKLLVGFDFKFEAIKDSYFKNVSFYLKKAHESNIVIVDSYLIYQKFLDKLKMLEFKLIVIDDFNSLNFENIDLIINFTICAEKLHYKSNDAALGIRYFINNPELIAIRERKVLKFKQAIDNILVFISGITFRNGNSIQVIIDSIDKSFNHLTIYLISNQYINFISANNNALMQYAFVENIESLYEKADFVVSGGGLVKYESAFCCVPNAAISVTNDQLNETIDFEKMGLTLNWGIVEEINKDRLIMNFQNIIKNTKLREKIWNNCVNIFKTDSTINLANKILSKL